MRGYTSRARGFASRLFNRLEGRCATQPASTAPTASALALALASALALAPALTAGFARDAPALTSLASASAAAEASEALGLGARPRRSERGCAQGLRVRERPLLEKLREAGRRGGAEAAEPCEG